MAKTKIFTIKSKRDRISFSIDLRLVGELAEIGAEIVLLNPEALGISKTGEAVSIIEDARGRTANEEIKRFLTSIINEMNNNLNAEIEVRDGRDDTII